MVSVDKLPPFNVEAEEAVIASMHDGGRFVAVEVP